MTIYQVFHCYDVDGGFGDAVERTKLIRTFENRDDAQAFVDRFSNKHVYATPYDNLSCGELYIKEESVIPHSEFDLDAFDQQAFWWAPPTEEELHRERMDRIREEWEMYFSDLPIDINGCIEEEYYNTEADIEYPVGTNREEIMDWFDQNYDGGVASLIGIA